MKSKKLASKNKDVESYDDEVNELLKLESPALHKVKKNPKRKKNVFLEGEKVSENVVQPAIAYLLQWNDNKAKWKFQKVRQVWLLQNMYDKSQVKALC